MWLEAIPQELRGKALAAWNKGAWLQFLLFADNVNRLLLVANNMQILKERGFYEEALLEAFTSTRVNNRRWDPLTLSLLFKYADLDQLRKLAPLPHDGPFTIFRGVGGRGRARRVRGFSWTGDLEQARFFARRAQAFRLHDPAIYQVTVCADVVVAFNNERSEQEFIVFPSKLPRPVRLPNQVLGGQIGGQAGISHRQPV
jgi:hypothetical protein